MPALITLHGSENTRLVRFDNARPMRVRRSSGKRRRCQRDHRQRMRTIQPFEDKDASTLLEDFAKAGARS